MIDRCWTSPGCGSSNRSRGTARSRRRRRSSTTRSRPSATISRLEAETGAQLLQRAGRRVRLTPAGVLLLAERAAEILGRLEGAGAELAAHRAERRPGSHGQLLGPDRLARPQAVAALTAAPRPARQRDEHAPARRAGDASHRQDRHRADLPLRRLRAKARRHPPAAPARRSAVPAVHRAEQTLDSCREATWIGGCERCRTHLLSICADEGFEAKIDYVTDDLIVMQSLVAAGLGVTTLQGSPCAPTTSRASRRPRSRIAPAHLRGDLRQSAGPARLVLMAALAEAAPAVAGIRQGDAGRVRVVKPRSPPTSTRSSRP